MIRAQASPRRTTIGLSLEGYISYAVILPSHLDDVAAVVGYLLLGHAVYRRERGEVDRSPLC